MNDSPRRNRRVTQQDPPLESAEPAPKQSERHRDTQAEPRVAKKRVQTRAHNENDARLLADRPPHWG